MEPATWASITSELKRDYNNTSWSADQLVDKWNYFKDLFYIDIINSCAPMETRRLKHRNNPWMNSHIIELIYKRDYLERKAIRYKTEETWLLYRRARNDVTEMIKSSKRQYYYENSIQESRHNPTQMWKVLKQLTHGNNRESPPNTLTADILYSFFTKIGLDTVSHLQPTLATGVDGGESEFFWRGSISTCCFNFTTVEQDCQKLIIKLDDVTNNDVLGFGSRLLFLSAYIIAPMLTTFYNVSIETQSVISDWKLSKVTPIIIESIARMTRVTIDL